MDKKAARLLEFDKIAGLLSEKCVSARAREMAREITPQNGVDEINRLQELTALALLCRVKKGGLPLGGLTDLRAVLPRLRAGGALSAEELLGVSDFLYVCGKVLDYFEDDKLFADEAFAPLAAVSEGLSRLPLLEREINRCIAPPGEMLDEASPELSRLRREARAAGERVREQLNGFIHSQAYKTMLQDAVVTMRGERFCVPVKLEYSGAFPGIAHDRSATGATVFMEPSSVVALNNKIRELKSLEKQEAERILRVLSELAAQSLEQLEINDGAVAELDFIFGKAELARDMDAARPVFNTDGRVSLKRARHPLIPRDSAVATDIRLGGDFTTLLITGPNTGGKTVTLKTIGLLTLMGQAGLHISAFDGSELAVFDDVFADIGDEQSIEQSLSTFSGHMSNIVRIMGAFSAKSLVLLDELGAGTDPAEGAALAISVLEKIRGTGAAAAVTTHYSELKVYAVETAGVENASCEFDLETLRPTYRLLIGVPGKSNAFEIARRLGLPEGLIENARRVMNRESARFEDVIADLEISRKTAEAEAERARGARVEAERLRERAEADYRKQEDSREKILERAREEARRIYLDAKSHADELLREYKERLRDENAAAIARKMAEKAGEYGRIDLSGGEGAEERDYKKGDRVLAFGKPGVVAELSGEGEAFVLLGAMRVKLPFSALKPDKKARGADQKGKPAPEYSARPKASGPVASSVDLRGMTADEGINKCDKYLDEAQLAGLAKVTVIHGKGTGALRAAIRDYLKRRGGIENFRPGVYGEGEDGVTVVELK
ncbi:MAG: endonuclease MutS2 [Clostridiales bacterium]|jgi:DNA mismatch repair protein MutS2|nr:endonuclease MutS2 [Clostridiales bacterium]